MEKILIVDDNVINRKLLVNMLKDFYEVVEAGSGREALEILSHEEDDILAVLLDLVMPEMDGFEVLKEIRRNTGSYGLPVIIQSEKSNEEFESKALKAGATDYVTKPYKLEVIRTRLQNAINTRIMLNEINALGSDEITGLMSINQFYFEGNKWINQSSEMKFDIVALDVVRFRIINDSKGVEGGNKVLISIANAIRTLQDTYTFIASRVYADRFVLLVERREGYLQAILKEADKITEEYRNSSSVHIKYGIYEITEDVVNLPKLCGRAFSAANLNKVIYGNQYTYYDKELHSKILFEEQVNDEMEYALKEGQFEVHFQPKYELFTGGIVGAEALIRWNHPVQGVISPGKFIPLFERNGFIVKLDQFVWDYAAEQIAEWYKDGKKIVPVSVNISRIDIENIDVTSVLKEIVRRHQISPELLHLEITESAYMQDTDKIIHVVTELKNFGFIIEMDDFGSGYSSLNMLAKLPINMLKLDMKFIQEIENSRNAKTIIEYTIGLAKWMNLPVVAEGVETEEQLELLKKLECNYVQGYIFARPMPKEQFEALLESSKLGNTLDGKEKQELYAYDNNQKYKMLIIEDLEMNRSIMRSYFEETFSIVEAVNGKVGIDYLKKNSKVDIIILDIYMPEMDGFEVLKQIENTPELKSIPVLVISAGTEDERKKALELGADGFISKPFTAEDIINKIRILLHSENILDDMNIWNMKEMIKSARRMFIYDDVRIIHMETGREMVIKGDQLVVSEYISDCMITKEVLKKCKKTLEKNHRRYMAIKKADYLLNIKFILFKGEYYMICFKLLLDCADLIRSEQGD